MNRKLKNMEYLLNFGSFILFFAIIYIVGSLNEVSDLVKFVLGVVSSLGVIGLSFLVSNSLKMESSARLIHLEGCFLISFFYFLAGDNGIFGTWFNPSGGGSELFYAVLFLLITILLILSKVRFKDYSYIHLSYVSILLFIFNIFKFLSLSYLEISVILVFLVLIPFIFIKDQKKCNFIRYILIGVMAYSNILVFSYLKIDLFSITSIILSIIGISFIAIKSKDIESKYFSILYYYFLFILIGELFSNNSVDPKLIYVLISLFACSVDLILNYCNKYFGNQASKFNKIVFTVFMLFLISCELMSSYGALLVVSIFVLLSSVTVLKLFKDDKLEKYLFPLKITLFTYALINFVSNVVINIPVMVSLFVMNAILLVFYKMGKDSKLNIEYTILILLLLLSGLTIEDNTSIVNFLVTLFMMLLDYLLLIVGENKDIKISGKIVYSIMLIASLLTLGVYDIGSVKYLIETLFLLILFAANDKVKFNVGITLPLIAINLSTYISDVLSNNTLSLILINLLWIVTAILFSYYLLKRDDQRDLLLSILLTFIVGVFIFNTVSDMLLAIYAISVSVMIIIGANKVNYKKLFSVGIGLGILSLVMLMLSIEGIPASVYLLFLGIAVVAFAIYMIGKYQKIENEKVRYCEECGTKLVGKVNQCTNCGKKVVD